MTVVRLSAAEVIIAANTGTLRCVRAVSDGRSLEDGRSDLGFGTHAVGAIGELAVSIALDCGWRPQVLRPDTDEGDVAGIQVRTATFDAASLIVRKSDPVDAMYVLAVIGVDAGFVVHIVGWLSGVEAKVESFWRERDSARGVHRSAYFAPQWALHPFEALKSASVARLAA